MSRDHTWEFSDAEIDGCSETEIVQWACSSDRGERERAWRLIMFSRRYGFLLYRFIYYKLDSNGLNPNAWQDIFQRTIITAVDKIATKSPDRKLLTWLCGIANNQGANYYRTEQPRQKRSQPLHENLSDEVPLEDEVFNTIIKAHQRALVEMAIANLSNDDQARIELILTESDKRSITDLARQRGESRQVFYKAITRLERETKKLEALHRASNSDGGSNHG